MRALGLVESDTHHHLSFPLVIFRVENGLLLSNDIAFWSSGEHPIVRLESSWYPRQNRILLNFRIVQVVQVAKQGRPSGHSSGDGIERVSTGGGQVLSYTIWAHKDRQRTTTET